MNTTKTISDLFESPGGCQDVAIMNAAQVRLDRQIGATHLVPIIDLAI
jgi:hypothetical protein